MPVLIGFLLVAALVVWANWGRNRVAGELGNRLDPIWYRLIRKKRCRWVATGSSGENLRQFHCETCGVTAYSASARGPKECKRGLTGGL
jgi:hypothetical protein